MARTGRPASRHVAAVARAIALLDALENGDELGTNDLGRRTGLNASTVSRLLGTLVAAGLVEHVPGSGRYRLGLRLVELGNTVAGRLDVRELARPHLVALAHGTGETATLSVPGERDAVTVDFVQSRASVQSVARLGRPSVGHATAAGKVALAFGDGPAGEEPLVRFTAQTITDPDELAQVLEEVRRRAWAEALGEREPDLNAIACPVPGSRGELAAILGVQGPASRFGRRALRRALPALLDHAAELAGSLGWNDRTDAPLSSRRGGHLPRRREQA